MHLPPGFSAGISPRQGMLSALQRQHLKSPRSAVFCPQLSQVLHLTRHAPHQPWMRCAPIAASCTWRI